MEDASQVVQATMPHHTRHTKKKKKPKRTQSLDIQDPQQLVHHRELALLRIAGGARPGRRRSQLLDERYHKLAEAKKEVEKSSSSSS